MPAIPYPPLDDPSAILPAVTTFTMAPNSKEAFRTRDEGVKTVTIGMQTVSPGCAKTMIVNLHPNAPQTPFPTLPPTATVGGPPTPDQGPIVPMALALAAIGGLFLARLRLPARR